METNSPLGWQRLEPWLAATLRGQGPLQIERIGTATGIANAMHRVRWQGRDLVLRHPPEQRITASAGNIAREVRLLAALGQTNVRHPRLIASCDDDTIIGRPFLLMDYVAGVTPVDPL